MWWNVAVDKVLVNKRQKWLNMTPSHWHYSHSSRRATGIEAKFPAQRSDFLETMALCKLTDFFPFDICLYITGTVSSVWAYFITMCTTFANHEKNKHVWREGVSEFHVDFSIRKVENSSTHIKIFQSRDNLPPVLAIICSDIWLLYDNTTVFLFVSNAKD